MASNAKNLAEYLNNETTSATADIADSSITTAKIADDAITGAKLANDIAISTTGSTTLGSTVGVNGGTGGQVAVNYSTASTTGLKLNDTNSGNLGGFIDFRSGSGAGTQRATIQNANNAGIHVNVGTGGSLSFATGYTSANALDDYEEGQWTPNVYNNARTSNWTTKKGDYIKIGKVVHCWFVCDHGNSNSGSGTGNLILEGMPFSIQVEATSGSTFAHNSTQSVGIWGANPSSQVGNLFSLNAAGQFQLYKGGVNQSAQITFVTGSFSYIAQ